MDTFTLENAIGYAVNRAALRMKAGLQRAFRAKGHHLTPEHWAVMNCLWEREGATQTEIAERVAKDKTNLTRILDVMERNGLIRRAYHETDRRCYRISLTKRAWKMKDALIAIAEDVNAVATRGLSAADEREIIRLMNTINENLVDWRDQHE
jgi:DNA-binding MarR family transcriptional regulator